MLTKNCDSFRIDHCFAFNFTSVMTCCSLCPSIIFTFGLLDCVRYNWEFALSGFIIQRGSVPSNLLQPSPGPRMLVIILGGSLQPELF